jgi:type VI secretion system secreted protein Hcp
MAQQDFLLWIDGVNGESKQVGQDLPEKCIDIESWSFGGTNSGSVDTGGGGGAGKVSMQDFHFVCKSGKSAAEILYHMSAKTHIPKAKLFCRKGGGDGNTYIYEQYEFDNINISSYQVGGSGGSDLLPHCQISFNYQKNTMEYKEQQTDGTVQTAAKAWYDQSTGTAGK